MFKIDEKIAKNRFFVLAFTGCKSADAQKTKIVAHRGASGVAPENTVVSTMLAFEKGADASEIDIYLTKDNRIMILHDKTTKRTCGVDMKIAESSSEELRNLDAGKFKSDVYAGEKIPFIEEIINVIPKGRQLFIEVKADRGIVPYLDKAVREGGKMDQMVIIAFDGEVLADCKKLMPELPMYWLKGSNKHKETGEYLPYDDSVIEFAVKNGFEGLDLHYGSLTKEFVDKASAADLEVHVWTVNDAQEAARMVECGVRSITTDYPDIIRKELGL